jgi:hypothetical protein
VQLPRQRLHPVRGHGGAAAQERAPHQVEEAAGGAEHVLAEDAGEQRAQYGVDGALGQAGRPQFVVRAPIRPVLEPSRRPHGVQCGQSCQRRRIPQ